MIHEGPDFRSVQFDSKLNSGLGESLCISRRGSAYIEKFEDKYEIEDIILGEVIIYTFYINRDVHLL
jgi:hypothetical protein